MSPKFYRLLGLCQRAGRLASGEVQAEAAVAGGRGKLILLATDASENTKKKWKNSAAFYALPLQAAGSRTDLGRALGEEERAVVVVTDEGFAAKLTALAEETI